jgi:hypothetical protein
MQLQVKKVLSLSDLDYPFKVFLKLSQLGIVNAI